jgi:probable HAF family extracellular repeat protein
MGFLLALAGALQAAPQYKYYTTGQGPGAGAVAINDKGQAVVNFQDRAYLWTLSGGLTDLGDLGGGKSYGRAINNLGQIVGESYLDATTFHAFLWDGQIHDLCGSNDGTMYRALSINNLGVVVGFFFSGNSYASPFQWTRASGLQPLDLQLIGGWANKIRDDGLMVGFKYGHAWMWTEPGAGTDLGNLPGFDASWPQDINQNGQMTGFAVMNIPPNAFPTHAFSWTAGGGLKDLGVAGRNSRAFGINNQGYIVGWSDFVQGDDRLTHGALWTPGGELLNLDTLVRNKPAGVNIGDAKGINQQGVIVGQENNDGEAYMLVPAQNPKNSPGALLLLLQ